MAVEEGVAVASDVAPTEAAVTVCLLVVNYNGRAHLDECLTSAGRSARAYGKHATIVCVDNQSTDGSREYVRAGFPDVEIVEAPSNDCLFSLNAVIAQRSEQIAIVVNNDMRFAGDFVTPLVAHFADADVFAVGAAILNWDGSAHTVGPRCARIDRCWFYKWWQYDCQRPALTLEACGGAVAYRRQMFVELGGFDPLYRPGYYEDLDLSYRAWTRGWKVVYEPCSRAYHKESASMLRRYGDSGKARLLYRNHLLFTVKNVGGPTFLLGFLALLPFRVLRSIIRRDVVPFVGFVRALPALPRAFVNRCRAPRRQLDLSRFETVTLLDSACLNRVTSCS